MRASELVRAVQEIIDTYGDYQVMVEDDITHDRFVEEVQIDQVPNPMKTPTIMLVLESVQPLRR